MKLIHGAPYQDRTGDDRVPVPVVRPLAGDGDARARVDMRPLDDLEPVGVVRLRPRGEQAMRQVEVELLLREGGPAEDLFQQTWLRVIEKARQFDERRSFEGWLFTIGRNLALDHLRRYQPESLDEPLPGEPAGEPREARLAADGPSALDRVLQRERWERLAAAMDLLPWIYREILTLRFEEEMKVEEMADVLDVPLSTAKTRLRRGLEMMRETLKKGPTGGAQA